MVAVVLVLASVDLDLDLDLDLDTDLVFVGLDVDLVVPALFTERVDMAVLLLAAVVSFLFLVFGIWVGGLCCQEKLV